MDKKPRVSITLGAISAITEAAPEKQHGKKGPRSGSFASILVSMKNGQGNAISHLPDANGAAQPMTKDQAEALNIRLAQTASRLKLEVRRVVESSDKGSVLKFWKIGNSTAKPRKAKKAKEVKAEKAK